ncbi:MAG: hypothetical protein GYA24_03860 [Candidatus Lokiarchaeota archaeon]|nr:hypothetical protein [Candidatus Lokiarchaeota archaeon]
MDEEVAGGLLDDERVRDLGDRLQHVVPAGREVFRNIIRGQAASRPAPDVVSTFMAYKDYLARLQNEMAMDEFEPDPILDEHIASATHVVECFTRMLRGEGISVGDASKADGWLRSVLDGDFMFTLDKHEP